MSDIVKALTQLAADKLAVEYDLAEVRAENARLLELLKEVGEYVPTVHCSDGCTICDENAAVRARIASALNQSAEPERT